MTRRSESSAGSDSRDLCQQSQRPIASVLSESQLCNELLGSSVVAVEVVALRNRLLKLQQSAANHAPLQNSSSCSCCNDRSQSSVCTHSAAS